MAIQSLFIDANVWYSAFYNSRNCQKIISSHSHAIIQAVISEQVLTEVFSNIKLKIPHVLPEIQKYFTQSPPVMIRNPKRIPPSFRLLAHPTDLPLIVACYQAHIPYFVTGNTKDFNLPRIYKQLKISILKPQETISLFNL